MSQVLTIIGNLAADPELKFTAQGKAQARFPVATSERFKNDKGEWESRNVTYWNCTAWDAQAENIVESLTKGDKVIVYGKAYTSSWEDKKTGEKRSRTEVTVLEVGPSLVRATARINRTGAPKPSASSNGSWASAQAVEADPWSKPFEDDVPPF